jgi:hypothetical protein
MAGGVGSHAPYGVLSPETRVPISAGFGGAIAGLSGGGWVNAKLSYWETPEAQGYGIEVSAYFLHGSQNLLSRTIKVPVNFQGNQENPSIIGLSNGNFVVAWQDNDPAAGDGSGSCIKARVFRLDKSKINDSMALHKIDIVPVTGEIMVNTTTALHQTMPVVKAIPSGGFAVAFHDIKGLHESDIRVATFNNNGARTSDDFLVHANRAGDQFKPDIAVLKDGRFVVSWQDGFTIRAQMFDPGNPIPDQEPEPEPDPETLSGGQATMCWTVPA